MRTPILISTPFVINYKDIFRNLFISFYKKVFKFLDELFFLYVFI